jgi:16S rRNA (guanine527-N7)-methyltransferase
VTEPARQEFVTLLEQTLAGQGGIEAAQAEAFWRHYRLLLHWNRKLNLTRIAGLREAVELHYAESVFAARHLPADARRIADVGSGGGFPGLVVAVMHPEVEVTLIEARERKAVFLREASRAMPNVRVEARRAEIVPGPFDCVTSRAVSREDLLACLHGLADRFLVLCSSADAAEWQTTPGAILDHVWPLPWGRTRVLIAGCLCRDR